MSKAPKKPDARKQMQLAGLLGMSEQEYQRLMKQDMERCRDQRIIDKHNQPKRVPMPVTGSRRERELAERVNAHHFYFDSVDELKYLFVSLKPENKQQLTKDMLDILHAEELDFFQILKCLKCIEYDIPNMLTQMSAKYKSSVNNDVHEQKAKDKEQDTAKEK